jgi:chromosome segregation ATPase
VNEYVSNGLDQATESLSSALDRLQQVQALATNDAAEKIAVLEQKIVELRAQCAVLIKENAALNTSFEEAESNRSGLEAKNNVVSAQLDSAIGQLREVLATP